MSTTDIVVTTAAPDEAAIQKKANGWLELVKGLVVQSQDDYDLAVGELRQIKGAAKAMDAERVSWVDPLNQQVKRLNAMFMPRLKLLEQAEDTLKEKMAAWLRAEEQRRAEERRRAEEAAEAERRRLEAEAQAARERAEAEAAALLAAAKGKKGKAEAEAQAQQVIRAAEAKADVLEQTAAVTTALPIAAGPVSKGAGISTPKTVAYEVEDPLALMRFIVEKRPDLVVLFDVVPAKMNAQVKLHGLKTDLPGVRVFERTTIAVR